MHGWGARVRAAASRWTARATSTTGRFGVGGPKNSIESCRSERPRGCACGCQRHRRCFRRWEVQRCQPCQRRRVPRWLHQPRTLSRVWLHTREHFVAASSVLRGGQHRAHSSTGRVDRRRDVLYRHDGRHTDRTHHATAHSRHVLTLASIHRWPDGVTVVASTKKAS